MPTGENYGRTILGSLIGPYATVDELERELDAANAEDRERWNAGIAEATADCKPIDVAHLPMSDAETRAVVGTHTVGFYVIDLAQHVEGDELRDRISPVFHARYKAQAWITANPK